MSDPYQFQNLYQKAMRFAGEKHKNQKIPSSKASYLVHLSNVAMETITASEHSSGFDLNFAVQVALLHDVIEDTDTAYEELELRFSKRIAQAVLALSKDKSLPADKQIPDSLNRIKTLEKEVWAVKLCDRITNMQEPPIVWSVEKRKNYQEVAQVILSELGAANSYLKKRLETKINEYHQYL